MLQFGHTGLCFPPQLWRCCGRRLLAALRAFPWPSLGGEGRRSPGREAPVCEAGPLPALRGGSGVRPPRRKVTVSLALVPVDLTPAAGRLCLAGLPGL